MHNTRAHGHIAPTVGVKVPNTTYTVCQHMELDPTDGNVLVRCTNPATLMPGYYRACYMHVLHTLNQSLKDYQNRAAAHLDPPHVTEHIDGVIATLTKVIQQQQQAQQCPS